MGRTDTVNKLRILVVDDEAILRLDLRISIKRIGQGEIERLRHIGKGQLFGFWGVGKPFKFGR